MLKLEDCVIVESHVSRVTDDTVRIEEGCALVHVIENGERKLRVSTGVTGEFFAGVSLNQAGAITSAPIYEKVTIPADRNVTLAKPLDGTQVRVFFTNGGGAVAAGNPGTTAGQYSRTGQVLTFNSADVGKSVTIGYRFIVSAREAMFMYGRDYLASDDVSSISNCGYINAGKVVTSCFDLSSDWEGFNASTPIKLGANGLFTLNGSGAVIDCIVDRVPSQNDGLLALRIHP